MEYKNEGADAKTQKKTHDEGVVKHEKREREKEYDGLTLKEMRRKHGIGENIGGEEILAAYKEDKINSVKREETAEEIAKQRKILEQAKMELEWDRKEREARRDLEGEESEHKMSRPEETLSRRANPLTSQDGAVKQGVFSNEHMDHGYGAAADVRRVVLYEGLKRDPRTGQSVATGDLATQYMTPGQVLERTLTLEGHIEIDKFSVEMMALEDVVILRDLCNAHLNQMVKKVSITT